MFLDERRMTKDERTTTASFSKAGVSLVTVLLFMLVATIAATATFKWLTSEGRSSGSRMQKQAAFQSSIAGIENARAWMTYNANDVGALIKQYKDTGNKIKLNDRLTPWLRANQNYEVWLTGVNTGSTHNFKLKILSSGKSAGGAVHNEVAIFNVDGLYRVQIPEETASIDFDKALFGEIGGDRVTNSPTIQSAVINGNYTGNQPKVSDNLLITGNATLEGNTQGLAGANLYVKGNVSIQGASSFGGSTNVAYIGGNVNNCAGQKFTAGGDLLVEGNFSGNCGVDVGKNFTIGGTLYRTEDNGDFKVGKNLVFKDNAVFNWTGTKDFSSDDGVGKYTYLSKIQGQNSNGGRKIKLGERIYLYSGFNVNHCPNKNNGGNFRPTNCSYCEGFFSTCDGDGSDTTKRYFSFRNTSNGTNFQSIVQTSTISTWDKDDNVLKNVSDNYWANIARMRSLGKLIKEADNKVPQPILLKDTARWIDGLANKFCGLDTSGRFKMTNGRIDSLNTCYEDALKEDKLYKGFLPIKWNSSELVSPAPTHELKYKFIFYATETLGQVNLPPTANDAANMGIVFLYLRNGGRHAMGNTSKVYNYFIYSEGSNSAGSDGKSNLYLSDIPISGAIIMGKTTPNGTIGSKINISDEDVTLNYKKAVLDALATAGLIQENEEYTALARVGEAVVPEVNAAAAVDDYYIAAAPQLNITLESQYENNEPLPTDNDQEELSQSYIILPRVIYLPTNPYGKLTDYFNVINLNVRNTALQKDEAKITGCEKIPKIGLLYDRENIATATSLPYGLHECHYEDDNQDIPFYIFVSGNAVGSLPEVRFDSTYKEMGSNTVKHAALICPVGSDEEFRVKVSKPDDLPAGSHWTITPEATYEGTCGNTSSFCIFKLHFNTDCSSPKNLFRVETSDATEGTVDFQIMECTGCQTGYPSDAHFSISSSFLVNRSGLLSYCSGPGAGTEECSAGGAYYERMQPDWPDCEDGGNSWVRAVGYNSTVTNNCALVDLNESWTCGISSDIKFEAMESGVPVGCEAIIPPEATNHLAQSNLVAGNSGNLYAQLKAKKVQLKVKFAGTVPTGANISVSSNRFATDQICSNVSEGCSYWLFAGDDVSLTISAGSKAEFSYWKCNPDESVNCVSEEPFSGQVFTIPAVSGDNEIVAWFGQKDKHCFFDEFTTAKECTGIGDDWQYCFNYCKDDALEECKIGNGELTDKAKWIVLGDSGFRAKLQYSDGRIWLDSSYNRAKKQSEVTPLTILSTAQAGFYGTLLAQFQVPRLGRESDETSARVNKSGFLLRSSEDASSYVILNVFANKDGKLVAKACVGGNCSETKFLKVGPTDIYVSSTDIVTMSVRIRKVGPKDELEIFVVGGYYGNYETGRIHINLSDIPGYTSLSTVTNEYVGFSLADPAFKIYDIGWKSETYNAECWKTPPTVKCSFRAAYLGGIVPLGKKAQPWVGLSSWFDGKDCSPQYYYKGDDACQKTTSDYGQCSDLYTFEKSGAHGGTESQSAKVVVQECNGAYITERTRKLLYTGEALCGSFWVGATNECSENLSIFSGTPRTLAQHSGSMDEKIYSESTELFALSGHANMRSATLQVLLQNDAASEVEVYLRSETSSAYYGATKIVYSNPVVTTNSTGSVLSFNVDEMSNVAGFDPEHVTGVIIRNLGSSSITVKEIKTNCNFAPALSCVDARYDAGKFKITVKAKNSTKASSYKVTAEENGASVSDLGLDYDCVTLKNCLEPNVQGNIVFNTANYDPYSSDAVKKYVFEVSMKTKDGNIEKHVEGSPCKTDTVVISGATAECKWNNYDGSEPYEIVEGGGFPPFRYSVDCPPGKSCPYEIRYESTKIHEGPSGTNGFVSIPSNKTSDINSAEHPLTVNSQYTVSLRSKNGGVAFATCTKTFKIKKKPAAALALTCGLTNQTNRVVGVQQSTAGTVSATGCGTGETCTWAITEGSSTTSIGSGNFGETPYSFTGANEAGLHTYKFKVSRASDGSADSCSFTVDYPLNLTCGTFSDPGTATPAAAGASVSPASPTVTTGDVSGCNGNCSYEVTGGNNVSGGSGSNYTGTGTISSFTDTGVSGATEYNLVITHGTGTAAKTLSCPFTVTYASTEPAVTCHCASACDNGCNNIEMASKTYNDNAPYHCVFFVSAAKLNLGDHTSKRLKINGRTFTGNLGEVCKSESECSTWLSSNSVSSVDGGYYMYLGDDYSYADVNFASSYDPCAAAVKPVLTACPVKADTVVPGRVVVVTPTLSTTCNTQSGCTYTISGDAAATGTYRSGSIEFTDDDASNGANRSYNLVLSTNKGSSSACAFSVAYSANATTDIVLKYGGPLVSLSAGRYHVYSDNPNSGVLRCEADASTTVTINNNQVTISTSLSSVNGVNPRPTVYANVIVPSGKTIRCMTDW